MRDRRLDFWRGLCLIDMILVHLVYEGIQFGALGPVIVDYTRFAAGGFVFVAGLGVGLIFLVGIGGAGSPPARTAVIWRRALYLLGVHYALTGLVVALEIVRGLRAPAGDPFALLRDIVLLQIAPPYIDVLPLYVAMLLITPLLLALLQRGLWPVVAAASALVFALGRVDPTRWSPPASVEFPFLLWQAFFVAGLLFSLTVPRLDRSDRAWRRATAGAWLAFGVVTALAYGPRFGLFPEPALVSFVKVPLTTGELLRYLAATLVVVTTSAVTWRLFRDRAATDAVAMLGRRSLTVYGGHVFVQMAALLVMTPLWWLGSGQSLVVAPLLAILWLLARSVDAWHASERPAHALRRVLRSWGAPPAGIVAATCLLALVRLTVPTLDEAADDLPPAEQIVDADLQGPGIELVDAIEDPSTNASEEDAGADDPLSEEPTIETLDDDAPIQSGIASRLVV